MTHGRWSLVIGVHANRLTALGEGLLEPVKTPTDLLQILQCAIFAQKQSIEVFSNILPDMVSRCSEPSSLLIEVLTNELFEIHMDQPEGKRGNLMRLLDCREKVT